jgi:hypothetical protein
MYFIVCGCSQLQLHTENMIRSNNQSLRRRMARYQLFLSYRFSVVFPEILELVFAIIQKFCGTTRNSERIIICLRSYRSSVVGPKILE